MISRNRLKAMLLHCHKSGIVFYSSWNGASRATQSFFTACEKTSERVNAAGDCSTAITVIQYFIVNKR